MKKLLIISVGGTISPIIYSIKHHNPNNIIFFTSLETETQIAEIFRRNELKDFENFEKIVTPSAEDINLCMGSILNRLPEILSRWGIGFYEVIVDYTGGTKSMSSALVLATIEYTKCFSYIGGEKRNKDGIGVVINGQERALILKNPWDELAIEEKKKICLLFNSGRYLAAKEVAERTINKVSQREKPFFEILKRLINGYYMWDSFKYNAAQNDLSWAKRELKICCTQLHNRHNLFLLLNKIEDNEKFLKKILSKSEHNGPITTDQTNNGEGAEDIKREEHRLYDMLANAKRRAILENRYDDAIVRIYSVLEKKAQLELKKYGIEASNINPILLPKSIRNEIETKCFNEKKKKIEVGLYNGYKILKAKEEEIEEKGVGYRFFENFEKLIKPILNLRNSSIIVHGENPLDEKKFNSAWVNCLEFLEIEEKQLPQFPILEL